jgi:hypothetical protein
MTEIEELKQQLSAANARVRELEGQLERATGRGSNLSCCKCGVGLHTHAMIGHEDGWVCCQCRIADLERQLAQQER